MASKPKSRTGTSNLTKKANVPIWAIALGLVVLVGLGAFFVFKSFATPSRPDLSPITGSAYAKYPLYCSQGVCKLGPHTYDGKEAKLSDDTFVRIATSCRTKLKYRDRSQIKTSNPYDINTDQATWREYNSDFILKERRKDFLTSFEEGDDAYWTAHIYLPKNGSKGRSGDQCVVPQNVTDATDLEN